jgi:hypothetical protein
MSSRISGLNTGPLREQRRQLLCDFHGTLTVNFASAADGIGHVRAVRAK